MGKSWPPPPFYTGFMEGRTRGLDGARSVCYIGGMRTLLLAAAALWAAAPVWARHEAAWLSPRGAAILIDPGHGGDDLGAVVHGRREKDLALAISLKLRDRLVALGAPARLTREDDSTLGLDERVGIAFDCAEGLFVSLHLNEVRHKSRDGIIVFAYGQRRFQGRGRRRGSRRIAPLPAPGRAQARASSELASEIVRSLRQKGFRVDPPAKAGFYVLKNPGLPSVLIELGYLSNPAEAARLADPAYQDRLADALAESLHAYFAASTGVVASAR